jgi:hypothetical protein
VRRRPDSSGTESTSPVDAAGLQQAMETLQLLAHTMGCRHLPFQPRLASLPTPLFVFRHAGTRKGTREMHAAVFVAGLDQYLPGARSPCWKGAVLSSGAVRSS